MEIKDVIYATSIAVTLILGIWNFVQLKRAARRSSFINTVTSQRILWIERLRQDIGRFVGLTHHWTRSAYADDEKYHAEVLREIDTLRYIIRLRLNPNDTPDRRIADLIKKIPDLTDASRRGQLEAAIENLVSESQRMIKAEWDKVKAEAKDGDLKEIKEAPNKSFGETRRE